jgi:hypothetical protein
MEEDLDAALNTYIVLVGQADPMTMLKSYEDTSFFIDISNYPYLDYDSRIEGANAAIEVLEYYEYYEHCADLVEYIKELEDEIQRLSTKNNISGD